MPDDAKTIAAWREFREARGEWHRSIWGAGSVAPTVDSGIEERLVRDLIRAGSTPNESAVAFRRLLDLGGCTARDLGGFFGVAPAVIVMALSLLEVPTAMPAAQSRKRRRGKRAA